MRKAAVAIMIILIILCFAGCQKRGEQPVKQKGARENVSVAENPGLYEAVSSSAPESKEEPVKETDRAPEEKTAAMLSAMKSGDPNQIRQFVDYDALFGISSGQDVNPHFAQILKNMSYQVLSSSVEDKEAEVFVKITNIDMAVVLPEFFMKAAELEYDNALSEDPASQAQMEKSYTNLFGKLVAEYNQGKIEKLLDIKLTKTGENWNIEPTLELANAALGGYITTRSLIGETAQPAHVVETVKPAPVQDEIIEDDNGDNFFDEIDKDIEWDQD